MTTISPLSLAKNYTAAYLVLHPILTVVYWHDMRPVNTLEQRISDSQWILFEMAHVPQAPSGTKPDHDDVIMDIDPCALIICYFGLWIHPRKNHFSFHIFAIMSL